MNVPASFIYAILSCLVYGSPPLPFSARDCYPSSIDLGLNIKATLKFLLRHRLDPQFQFSDSLGPVPGDLSHAVGFQFLTTKKKKKPTSFEKVATLHDQRNHSINKHFC